MSDIEELIEEIEILRKELESKIESETLNGDIIEISQKLDVLIVQYTKRILESR